MYSDAIYLAWLQYKVAILDTIASDVFGNLLNIKLNVLYRFSS